MSLVIIPQIVEVNGIMMIGHCTASIIAYYHTSNMAAVFFNGTLEEPQIASLRHPGI